MRTWEDWSDFEVNKAVAIAIGHKCYYDDGTYTNDGENVTVKGKGVIGWFNPCNEWEDIGPIIERNNITIACYDGEWSAFSGFRPWADTDIRDNETHCKNIKRAAAIVFLIMNGVNPD